MRRLLVLGALVVVALSAGRPHCVDLMQHGLEQGRQAGWNLLIGEIPPARPNIGSTVLLDYTEAARALAGPPAPNQRLGGSCSINWKQNSQAARGALALTLNSMCLNDIGVYNDQGTQYVVYSVWNPFVQLSDKCLRVKAPPETDAPTVVRLDYSFTYDVPRSKEVARRNHEQGAEFPEQEDIGTKPDAAHTHVTVSVVSGAEVGLWNEGEWTPLETNLVADKAWVPGCTLMWGFTWSVEPRCWGNFGKYALWLDHLTFGGKVVDASTLYRRNWHSTPAPGFWVEGTKTGTIGLWGPSYDTITEVRQPCQQPSSL